MVGAVGRPREERIDHDALDAVRELLSEVGYAALTLESVAHRASTTKPALRRRWPSRKHLVVDALIEQVRDAEVPDTGCTHCDLVECVEAFRHVLDEPAYGPTLRTLLVELHDEPALRARLLEYFFTPRQDVAKIAFERGMERGHIRRDVRVDVLLDMLASVITHRVILGHRTIGPGLSEEVVSTVLRGVGTDEWVIHHAPSLAAVTPSSDAYDAEYAKLWQH